MKLLKLIFNTTAIYILVALTFGIETAFIALMCVVVPIVLIQAIAVMRAVTSRCSSNSIIELESSGYDYWTPGQPATTIEAITQGFL